MSTYTTDSTATIKSQPGARIYRRESIAALPKASNQSCVYSRSQARQIFATRPEIDLVEYCPAGRKTDSQLIGRGVDYAPAGCYVIIASTGGKFGKSRRNFAPRSI